MQDIRSMSGAAGRIFGGDRRMRPHLHQALKCPRCDSLNTKFCYYNNYNLSQPRHFCKSCRRYWTKGGVLRNVPVGGGSRKTKRSKPKSNATDDADEAHRRDQRKSAAASHSSSDSSTLTATAASAPTTAEAPASAATASSSSSAALLNFPDSAAPMFSNTLSGDNPPQFDPPASMIEDSSIFSEAGTFTSLMTGSNPALLGINFADLAVSGPFKFQQPQIQQQQQQQQKMVGLMEEMKMQELTAGFLDQTVSVELPPLQSRGINAGLTALDWQSNGDQGLFDLAGGVIDQAYWAQTQWVDNDHTLYLP